MDWQVSRNSCCAFVPVSGVPIWVLGTCLCKIDVKLSSVLLRSWFHKLFAIFYQTWDFKSMSTSSLLFKGQGYKRKLTVYFIMASSFLNSQFKISSMWPAEMAYQRDSPAKINVSFKCSIFQEDNNGTIYFGVQHMLKELLQSKGGTIWCIYVI